MTIVDKRGTKIILPRLGPDDFWPQLQGRYVNGKPRRWKYLAMFALYECAGWNLEQIGLAFGHNKGHVQRCMKKLKDELRRNFADGRTETPQPLEQARLSHDHRNNSGGATESRALQSAG